MAQVIIVSNRLPVSVKKEGGKFSFSPSIGGLATGLSSYANTRNSVWIGWPGIPSDDLTDAECATLTRELKKYHCSPIFLTKKQIDDFYNGYSNALLWPIFHNLPYTDNDDKLHKRWWQAYRDVNRQFAEAVISQAKPRSQIWVHDYQLLLVPEMLRRELDTPTVGFFLHIPFPEPANLDKLPEAKKLLRGMLGANLLGFHTPSYVQAFLANCHSSGLGVVSENSVVIDSHVVRVGDFPMGIDYKKYANANKTRAVKNAVARFQKKYRGQKVIVAIDRLDPSKGLVERLEAYDAFLARTPKLRSKVVFSMVAAPSRTDIAAYQDLSLKLERLVTEINNKYGTSRWQPVDYMNEAQPFEVVTALFQIADVAFIAPLKDGMNLAAKEFVASNRKNGALILSETAGAAEELHSALIVNPRQTTSLVNALQRALTMQPAELRTRLRKMKRYIAVNSVQSWAKSFVETLQQPLPGTQVVVRTRGLTQGLQKQILQDYDTSKKRLFLLDYDGSLVPFSNDRNDARPPKRLLNLLEKLSQDKRNDIVVVSGRSSSDLEKWLGKLPINLVAEHGASTKKAKQKWHNLDRSEERWKREIQPVLLNYAALTPGAQVEVKMHSLVWHYRSSPPYYAQKYAVTIKRVLKPLLKKYGVQLFQGNKVLEIKNPDISKGKALRKWLDTKHDFVLVVGDDFTDEDMFKAAPADSYTIKVGRGRTAARYRLDTSDDVKKLLAQFTK